MKAGLLLVFIPPLKSCDDGYLVHRVSLIHRDLVFVSLVSTSTDFPENCMRELSGEEISGSLYSYRKVLRWARLNRSRRDLGQL